MFNPQAAKEDEECKYLTRYTYIQFVKETYWLLYAYTRILDTFFHLLLDHVNKKVNNFFKFSVITFDADITVGNTT